MRETDRKKEKKKEERQRKAHTVRDAPLQKLIAGRCARGQFLRFMSWSGKVVIWHPQNVDTGERGGGMRGSVCFEMRERRDIQTFREDKKNKGRLDTLQRVEGEMRVTKGRAVVREDGASYY